MLVPTQILDPAVVGAVAIAIMAMASLAGNQNSNGQSIEKAVMLGVSTIYFTLMAIVLSIF